MLMKMLDLRVVNDVMSCIIMYRHVFFTVFHVWIVLSGFRKKMNSLNRMMQAPGHPNSQEAHRSLGILVISTLGPEVSKYDLHWAIIVGTIDGSLAYLAYLLKLQRIVGSR